MIGTGPHYSHAQPLAGSGLRRPLPAHIAYPSNSARRSISGPPKAHPWLLTVL